MMRAGWSHGRLSGWIAAAAAIGLVAALGGCRQARGQTRAIAGGDPERGKALIQNYGCNSCHMIPGVQDGGTVGPPLTAWSRRTYIAGEVQNTPDFLIRWIEMPQAIEPGTVMPNLGVTEGNARDIAAYLYTIR
ncbi:MAG TPA: cytochrome c [Gemmatimonadaceae bacterium]|nr:cytochrome c [Gemmatimonadaceae bacterium]